MPTLELNTYEKMMMLNTHELYLLAETPSPRAASASTNKRNPYYRRCAERHTEHRSPSDRLSVDHVAVLGED